MLRRAGVVSAKPVQDPVSAGSAARTPLAAQLVERVAAFGPMTIAEYMATCLSDPRYGYYMGRDPFGRSGDFVTAPEISQIFGELIGLWCVSVWLELGSPESFNLAELGPGRGTLMADALRASAVRPGFAAAANIALVEISPTLRERQRETLADIASPVWINQIDELPPGPTILVANEFFDAMPIRQFVFTGEGWAERLVGLDDNGGLAFGLGPASAPIDPTALPGAPAEAEPGAIFEIRPAAEAIVEAIAGGIAEGGGGALIIDYGHPKPSFGDTLQAIHAQRFDHPLAHPGEADLTAHVDFSALVHAAKLGGANPSPIIEQSELLNRLGIVERARQLIENKDDQAAATITSAVARLMAGDQMGRLFKAMALSSENVSIPGFGQ